MNRSRLYGLPFRPYLSHTVFIASFSIVETWMLCSPFHAFFLVLLDGFSFCIVIYARISESLWQALFFSRVVNRILRPSKCLKYSRHGDFHIIIWMPIWMIS